ncbi:DNA helicase RecD, partial [Streptomyces somaliensis DSM 40738]|nr:DNA helicase RecD [Streptomyces somaliensis DSM 40738]
MTAHPRGESPNPPAAGTAPGASAPPERDTARPAPASGPGAADADARGAEGTEPDADGGAAAPVPEALGAQAVLAAQRELRERIERRRAERGGPIESGAKLSGRAADLLAAVRA